jgi:UDP-N-acetylmuramoyl-L-alanyl-D-glutamate--2,6-diaminopimelate ligase
MILIGVTGTDGKTTTCHLIHHILTDSGIKAGLISTTGAKIGDKEYSTKLHMTSPDPFLINRLLQKMVEEKCTHLVCEVTAHALDQYRFFGFKFKVAAITNTSHEHLDYFSNMEKYTLTKSKLFDQSDYAVLNKDDPSFSLIKPLLKTPFTTFGIDQKSDYQAKNIKLSDKNLEFDVNKLSISTNSNYHYQIYNILAALAVTNYLNIDPQILLKTVKIFPEVKGRHEELNNDFDFKTIIDFAHTPNALKNTLDSLKQTNHNRLIVIFGATGGRDKSKRPQMGEVVSQFANIAFITADDTRDEKIEDINQQIISGIKTDSILIDHNMDLTQIKKTIKDNSSKFIYFNIPNRQDAFNLSVQIAQSKDIIITCGKGHETTILHGKTEYPWSETEAFRTAFRLKTSKNDDSI